MRHFDVRLIVGIGLVTASVAGVYGLVLATDKTTAVYVASQPIPAGHTLEMGDLHVVHVRLAAATSLYVDADGVPSGAVTLRALSAGEFIPRSAVGSARVVTTTTLVITVVSAPPQDVTIGTSVDVWAAPQQGQSEFGAPTIIVARAEIARILENSGIGSAARGVNVEVVIPRSKVAVVLQAQANGDAISLVPTVGASS